jgi:iron complex outermembrane receptor protein
MRPIRAPAPSVLAQAVLAAIATSFAASAAAQQAPLRGDRIEVTGSAIKRTDAETALPVTIITREDIDRAGAVSTEDLLRRITASTAMMSDTNQGVGYAVSNANLRGLGASSTLVLLNGRRLANHAFGSIGGFGGTPTAVDLNSIPFSAIERVEVLRDGASAIYGTDAVGGVVNFITRTDYRGGEATVNYGRPEDNIGGTEQGASVVYGVGDLSRQGWNLLLTGRVQYNKSVAALDQKLYARASDIPGATFPTSFRAFPGRIMDFGFSPGAYAGTLTTNPAFAGCDPEFTTLQVSGTTPSGNQRIRCRGIYAAYVDNLPDSHKADVYGRWTMNVNADNQFFAEASFARNHNIGRVAPVPIDQTATHIRPDGSQPNIQLPLTSRYAPVDLLQRLGYNVNDVITPGFLEIAYRSADVGRRTNDNTNDQTRLSTGFKGAMSGWDYDTALTYARADDHLKYFNYVQEQRFIDALRTGNLNPFGPNDAAGVALLNSTRMEGDMRKSKSEITTVDGRVARDLMKLDGGPLSLALGADYRHESIDDKPVNADYSAGLHVGGEGTVPHTTASRNVFAVFAEVNAPVIRNVELSAALRYDHYDDVGSNTSPRVSGRWQAMPQLVLRASAAKGFRAPSLWDLHSPNAFGNTANSVVDPGCPAALIADEDARCVDTQLNVRNTSNPNLKPETSKQWSAGFVMEPMRALSVAVDYWRIEKEDQIGTVLADAILANPNDLTLYNRYISRFVRTPIGTTLYVDQPIENLGELKTAGWDIDARYRYEMGGYGRFQLGFQGTYWTEWKFQLGKDFPLTSYLGNSFNGGNAYPRWNHVFTLDWSQGPWLVTLENTYTSGWTEAFLAGGTHEIAAISRWNLAGTWSGIKNLSIKLGVRNIEDKLPPYTDVSSNGSHAAGYPNAQASPLGRVWYATLTYRFK